MGAFVGPVPASLSNAIQRSSYRSFRSLDSSDTQQSMQLLTSPLPPRNGVVKKHSATGVLQNGLNSSATGSLKRVRSQEDSFAYDQIPSGDDFDQPKEDTNRAKS